MAAPVAKAVTLSYELRSQASSQLLVILMLLTVGEEMYDSLYYSLIDVGDAILSKIYTVQNIYLW